jgi:HEAT repeat protein
MDRGTAPTIEGLIKILQDSELVHRDPGKVAEAIRSLGRRKAQAAIPYLIDLLGFRYRRPSEGGLRRRPIGVSSRYPATGALFAIGEPALPSLLEVVRTRDFDSIESKNARQTIRQILREEPGRADELFKEAAGKALYPVESDRLLRSIETAEEDMKLNREDM